MRPQDLLDMLRTRPFRPFRIHMTDGRTYDVVHPEAVFVLKSRAIVGLRPDPETGVPDRSEDIALLHIVRTSEIPALGQAAASSPAN
jgi:hypothetical protein